MENLLFGVSATDPLTFVVIALSLLFVAFSPAGSWRSGRRRWTQWSLFDM